MTSISLPRKVFQGVAKRADMFRMFDRHAQRPKSGSPAKIQFQRVYSALKLLGLAALVEASG